jgi:peptide/nickel transport system substrate-binding protein
VALHYTPIAATVNPPADKAQTTIAFRLGVSVAGVPQNSYSFAAPITVTLTYSDTDIRGIGDENSLVLYFWNGESWQDASTTCAQPYKHLDTVKKLLEVRVCHLSEFSLMGAYAHHVYLPQTNQ